MDGNEQQFYHALAIDRDKCVGCTHCMKTCPTGAIRIRDGKAAIRTNWCVDCAECMRVCPAKAIYVGQDDFHKIFDFKCRVALLPALFLGQFPDMTTEKELYDAIYSLGFTHICPVEITVDAVHGEMMEQIATARNKPAISPYCPAIVRLLQVRFPDLADNILSVKTPVEATAILFRRQMESEGYAPEEIGIFYASPCAAKIVSLRDENQRGMIDGVMNVNFLYNKVYGILQARPDERPTVKGPRTPKLTRDEAGWSLTSGEADNFAGRCFAVDEIHNVINFIEKMEMTGEINNIDFLELRACDRGCVGGILTPVNRFLAAERLHKHSVSQTHQTALYDFADPGSIEYMVENIRTDGVVPRGKLVYDGDINEVLRKMDSVEKLLEVLPGIDCGACGSPDCKSLAEDIMRGEARFSNCVFMQRRMEKSGEMDTEKAHDILDGIWGKGKTEKKS